jgi:hypothetical protein
MKIEKEDNIGRTKRIRDNKRNDKNAKNSESYKLNYCLVLNNICEIYN